MGVGENGGRTTTIGRAPISKPPFTLSQLKNAVPPHCFRRSLLRSFSYLIYDLVLAWVFYYVASTYIPTLPYPYSYVAWPAYWAFQGCICSGVWVIAHECGHHAFSDYQWVDDLVGMVLHSFLMVPYFSWKFSHRNHHSNIACLEKDVGFVPPTKSKIPWYSVYRNNPLGSLFFLVFALTFGWPLYLLVNATGPSYGRFASHFDPHGPIFKDRQRAQAYISNVGIVAVTYFLYRVAIAKGLSWLICIYVVPLLIVNAIFSTVAFLQHTHPALPHYDTSEWDWMRGALSTVDRDYGVLNKVFHNITDTHVAHHFFSTMPHYHAMEATKAIKPILGEYYQFDGTPVFKAMWREAKQCLYVEPDENSPEKGVFWYQNRY